MKTTDKKALAYIATLSREALERLAFDSFTALNKDAGKWLDDEDDFPSGADVCEALDGALSDSKLSIGEIEEFHARESGADLYHWNEDDYPTKTAAETAIASACAKFLCDGDAGSVEEFHGKQSNTRNLLIEVTITH